MPAYKDKSGKWYCSFYFTAPNGQRKKKKKSGFALKREAEAWERDFLTSHNPNEDEILSLPFDKFIDRYMADRAPHVKAMTLQHKSFMIKKHIRGKFRKPINQITAPDLQAWVNRLEEETVKRGKEKPYSHSTKKAIIEQLKSIFNHAERLYGLSPNPIKRLTMPPNYDRKKEMKFWTLDEFNKAIKTVIDIQAKTELIVMFWTGIRKGELYALQWQDFKDGCITVSKTYHRYKGKALVTSPKTKGSNRTIALPAVVVEVLEDWWKVAPSGTPKSFIFPWGTDRLKNAIDEASKLTGVKRIRVHDLRHSHASLLINQGVNIQLISKRLGHEKTSMTLDTYGHLYPTDEHRLIQTLDDITNS